MIKQDMVSCIELVWTVSIVMLTLSTIVATTPIASNQADEAKIEERSKKATEFDECTELNKILRFATDNCNTSGDNHCINVCPNGTSGNCVIVRQLFRRKQCNCTPIAQSWNKDSGMSVKTAWIKWLKANNSKLKSQWKSEGDECDVNKPNDPCSGKCPLYWHHVCVASWIPWKTNLCYCSAHGQSTVESSRLPATTAHVIARPKTGTHATRE